MRVHTNPNHKPHKCSHCGKGFREPSKVRIHEMIHTGEKPISCTKCEYRCSTTSALRAHERAHIGDKPHSCSRCEKKFATKDTYILALSTWRSIRIRVASVNGFSVCMFPVSLFSVLYSLSVTFFLILHHEL